MQPRQLAAAPDGRRSAPRSTFLPVISALSSDVFARTYSMENGVKISGGVVAALVAMRCAGSLRSACVLGLLSGLFAHSLYADVLRKRRRRGEGKQREERTKKEEEEEAVSAET